VRWKGEGARKVIGPHQTPIIVFSQCNLILGTSGPSAEQPSKAIILKPGMFVRYVSLSIACRMDGRVYPTYNISSVNLLGVSLFIFETMQ
jgi:hypothetical protein